MGSTWRILFPSWEMWSHSEGRVNVSDTFTARLATQTCQPQSLTGDYACWTISFLSNLLITKKTTMHLWVSRGFARNAKYVLVENICLQCCSVHASRENGNHSKQAEITKTPLHID